MSELCVVVAAIRVSTEISEPFQGGIYGVFGKFLGSWYERDV